MNWTFCQLLTKKPNCMKKILNAQNIQTHCDFILSCFVKIQKMLWFNIIIVTHNVGQLSWVTTFQVVTFKSIKRQSAKCFLTKRCRTAPHTLPPPRRNWRRFRQGNPVYSGFLLCLGFARLHTVWSNAFWPKDTWPTYTVGKGNCHSLDCRSNCVLIYVTAKLCVGQMSFGQMSVIQVSVGQMSVGQMSVVQMSIGKCLLANVC